MRLDEYWGIGPKTRALLREELGVEAAVTAIESGDVRTLVDAGLSRGRATQILRHANGGDAMDLLATGDARDVYNEVLELIGTYAVTAAAADRIRILTPLPTREAMADRQSWCLEATQSWADLSEEAQSTVIDTFDAYEELGEGRFAALETALILHDHDLVGGIFEPIAALEETDLRRARDALAGLSGTDRDVATGVDETLDQYREQQRQLDDQVATPEEVLEHVSAGARGPDQLRESLAQYLRTETGIESATIREAMPADARDAHAFVESTLRTLQRQNREAVIEREATVADELETDLEATTETVTAAVEAVDEIALAISLARFAIAHDLTRPELTASQSVGVVEARNLFLEAADEDVQPITYAIGDHDLSVASANEPPAGDRVAVLTGANSGGKTTLLETLCQVQLLAQMGLPVPARAAVVGPVETIVFHRRHASFNAGVLESTLRTVVPPVTAAGRTIMLVDEFEAITEPGSAADLLHGLVTMTVQQEALGVFVTHLAEDLEPLPEEARTDGIFAEGLTPSLELEVDYQPRFETIGRSTPEFIVSRLVADASDRNERAGYRALAEAVGEEAVQRTLSDAKWEEHGTT